MTQEEKQILIKDLSMRLPYGVIYHRNDGANIELREVDIKSGTLNYTDNIIVRECKPYLRPMSSMTEEEKKKVYYFVESHKFGNCSRSGAISDYLNSIHIDYRNLIEKGLALEAPEGMYKTE